MTVHHHTRHSRFSLRKYVWGIFSLLVVFAFSGAMFFSHVQHNGASPEVSFTDASAHGLAIVPASCPSQPVQCIGYDSIGNCTAYSGGGGNDADSPYGCSGPTPLCPNGTPAPNGEVSQCSSPTPPTPGPTPHGCGAGTLNDQCAPGNGGSCPLGYTNIRGACVFTGCPVGYTQGGVSSGYVIQCIFSGCPAGTSLQGTQCVTNQCSASYQCQGNNLYYESASCSLTFARTCTYGCSAGACNPPVAATGTLSVVPALVKREATTNVSWNAQNVVVGSCTVKGTNGDNWAGATGSQTSGPIPSQTVYTLQCTGLDNTPLEVSKVVNIAPGFCETGAPGCN